MTGIIIAAAVVSIVGLILGLFLGFMGKKFAVEVDQKEIDVRAELPGNNCGGCGYAGCDALAKAIAAGEAEVGACPVGGEPVAKKIAAIMGSEVGDSKRMTAFVKCAGDCEKAKENYLNKIPSTVTGKEENKVITIEKIINVVIDGNTYYYITDTEGSKYKVSIKVEKDVLPYLTEGSVLNVYYNSKTDVTNITKLEKALD